MAFEADRDEYLAALSLSSLDGDSDRDPAELDHVHGLGRSSHGFDELNNNPPVDSSVRSSLDGGEDITRAAPSAELSELRASFVTIEQDGPPAQLSFKLERDLLHQEVVAITIYSVPHYIIEEDFMGCVEKKRSRGIDFIPLCFSLRREPLVVESQQQHPLSQSQSKFSQHLQRHHLGTSHRSVKSGSVRSGGHDGGDGQVHIKAALFNGTYTLVLTTPHGSLKAGQYTLFVSSAQRQAFEGDEHDHNYQNISSYLYHQDLRVSLMIQSEVKATALPVIVQNPSLHAPLVSPSAKVVSVTAGAWMHFRVIVTDRQAHLPLSFHCWFSNNNSTACGGGGAIDLFVTNRYDGLLAVDSSTAIWRSIGTYLRAEDGHRKGYVVLRILPEDILLRDDDASNDGDGDSGMESFILGIRHSRADGDFDSSNKEMMKCELRVTAGENGIQHTIFRFDDENDYFPVDLEDDDRDGNANNHDLNLSGFRCDDHLPRPMPKTNNDGNSNNNNTAAVPSFGKEEHETLLLPHNEPRHFAVKFDPVERARIAVTMDLQFTSSSSSTGLASEVQGSMQTLATLFGIDLENGRRGASCSTFVPWMDRYDHNENKTEEEDPSSMAAAPSGGAEKKMLVLYLSATDAYPSPSSYTWRANGKTKAAFILDTAEWRYLSNTCYFSAYVVDHVDEEVASEHKRGLEGLDEVDVAVLAAGLPEAASSHHHGLLSSSDCVTMVRVWQQRDEQAVVAAKDPAQILSMRIFDELYRGVDAMRLSYKDRRDILTGEFSFGASALSLPQEAFDNTDDASFTYDEMDFLSFRECLAAAGAVDGQILYDLGSGVGRAITAAALTGICFTKIVGIELLPSLVQCGRDVIAELTAQSNSNLNASFNSGGGHHGRHHHHHRQVAPFATGNISPVLSNKRLFIEKDISMMDDLSVVSSSTYSYQVNAIPNLRDRLRRAKVALPILETRHENFLHPPCDWSDADFVLTCSACFSDPVMELLTRRMAKILRPGARWMTEKMPEEYREHFQRVKEVFSNSSSGRKKFVVLERNNVQYE